METTAKVHCIITRNLMEFFKILFTKILAKSLAMVFTFVRGNYYKLWCVPETDCKYRIVHLAIARGAQLDNWEVIVVMLMLSGTRSLLGRRWDCGWFQLEWRKEERSYVYNLLSQSSMNAVSTNLTEFGELSLGLRSCVLKWLHHVTGHYLTLFYFTLLWHNQLIYLKLHSQEYSLNRVS